MTPFNPDSWLDILAYVIIGAPALIAAVATLRHARRDKPIRDKVNDIHHQTVNNHPNTNLRNDIDKLAAAQTDLAETVKDGFGRITRELVLIREDTLQERKERARDDDDLGDRVATLERRYHPEPFG